MRWIWVGLAMCGALGCRGDEKTQPAPAPEPCIADRLPTLDGKLRSRESCTLVNRECVAACDAGDSVACYTYGLRLQDDPATDKQSEAFYRRACLLGHGLGCTNYAAGLLTGLYRPDDPGSHACAGRVFDKSCASGDSFGCGMRGRMLVEDATDAAKLVAARKALEGWCEAPGGFACRILALQIERGKFGAPDPGRIRELLVRACETGDRFACGRERAADGFE